MTGAPAVPEGRIVLVRHGKTEWSESGQHTGTTDIPLTPQGEADAATLSDRLARYDVTTHQTSTAKARMRTSRRNGLIEQAYAAGGWPPIGAGRAAGCRVRPSGLMWG